MFKIRRSTARNLLKQLGYEKADSYSDKLLVAKLQYLKDLTEEDGLVVSGPYKRIFATLRRSLAAGETPKIVEEPDKGDGKPKGRPKAEDGIHHTIIRMLTRASESRPLTKADILKELCEKFDDRDPQSMKVTLDKWVMSGIRNMGMNIKKSPEGYWIEPNAMSETRADDNV